MTIYYLMIKTHNITGLKYLCQTTRKDPYKYLGSGLHWKRHLKMHGRQVSTEIIRECQTKDELRVWGLHFSNTWNVVESDDWANLVPEVGDTTIQTKETIKRAILTKQKNNTLNNTSPESIQKMLSTKRKNGTMNGNSPESIRKSLLTKRQNGTLNVMTPEVIAKVQATRKIRGISTKGRASGSYDHTLYHWKNKETGQVIVMTQNDFRNTYKISAPMTSLLLHGKVKSASGWCLSNADQFC